MSYKTLSVVAVLLVAAVLAACGPQVAQETPGPGTTTTTSPLQPTTEAGGTQLANTPDPSQPTVDPSLPIGDEVMDYEMFVAALQAADTPVEEVGELEALFPGIPIRVVRVNGIDVQVSEFPDEATAQAAASTIAANGYTVGTSAIEWIEQPNFFAKGKIIVLYVGTDQATIEHLTQVMGQPLTGAQSSGGDDLPTAVQAAIGEISVLSGAAASEIDVVSFDQVEWPDACLGLPEQGEACATVITPGWRVVLSVDGKQYEVHTDANGENVRVQEL